MEWADAKKIFGAQMMMIYNWIVITKELAKEMVFLKVFCMVFGFLWGPLGSWVGETTLRVEDGVG